MVPRRRRSPLRSHAMPLSAARPPADGAVPRRRSQHRPSAPPSSPPPGIVSRSLAWPWVKNPRPGGRATDQAGATVDRNRQERNTPAADRCAVWTSSQHLHMAYPASPILGCLAPIPQMTTGRMRRAKGTFMTYLSADSCPNKIKQFSLSLLSLFLSPPSFPFSPPSPLSFSA